MAMRARGLKVYTTEELASELSRRRAGERMTDEEVRQFWLHAAGVLRGVDVDAWLADVRRERDVADAGEVE